MQTPVVVSPETGLTDAEEAVMDTLVAAAEGYMSLPVQHPTEQAEFVDAIHRCQDLMAVRIARRLYPQGWASYQEEGPREDLAPV